MVRKSIGWVILRKTLCRLIRKPSDIRVLSSLWACFCERATTPLIAPDLIPTIRAEWKTPWIFTREALNSFVFPGVISVKNLKSARLIRAGMQFASWRSIRVLVWNGFVRLVGSRNPRKLSMKLVSILIAALVVGWAGFVRAAADGPNDYYNEGVRLLQAGQSAEAIKYFSWAIHFNPRDWEAYGNRGLAYDKTGDLQAAIRDYSKAIELNPNEPRFYTNRGSAYDELGKPQQAIDDYNQAIHLNNKDEIAFLNRGIAYRDLGKPEQAIADLTHAIELNPSNERAYLSRGAIFDKLGQFESVVQDCNAALLIDPTDSFALVERGWARENLGQTKQAIQDFNRAIQLDPKNPRAYVTRGWSLINLGELDRAIQDFNYSLKLEPRFAIAYVGLGNAERAKGNLKAALEHYNKAIELDKRNQLAYKARGTVYFDRAEYELAIRDLTTAVDLAPRDAQSFDNLGKVYYAKGDFQTAIAEFTKAIEIDPSLASAYADRSLAIFCQGRRGASGDARAYLKLAGWTSDRSADMVLIGYFRSLKNDQPEEAQSLLMEGLQKCDKAAWPYPILAYLHHDLSIQDLYKQAGDNSKIAKVHAYLGIQLALNGRRDEAIEHLRWIKDHANHQSQEYAISLTELRRIENDEALVNPSFDTPRIANGS